MCTGTPGMRGTETPLRLPELLAVKQREEDLMAEVLSMHAQGCSQMDRHSAGR